MELPPQLTNIVGKLRFKADPNPRRDWLVLIVVFVAALVLSVVWSSAFFLENISREPESTGIEESAPDMSALEAVKEVAQERAEEALRYESEYRFVDPSR